MSGSSRRSYSVELHRLISSGELNRLLESCRSNPSGAAKSPSSRQANFAQYQLPLEEIQRWIAEQGQADPAASDSASAAPAGQLVQYTEAAAAAPAYTCAEPRAAAPSLPPAELSSTSSTAPHSSGLIDALVDVALSPTSAAVRATKSTAPSPMEHQWTGEYERQRAQAEQMLAALEWRARTWAQQAAAMQAESFRLRDQALVDKDRLASIEQLLMSTVNDLHLRQGTRRPDDVGACESGAAMTTLSAAADGMNKRARRQNHRSDQRSVLMDWFKQHEVDPYPNNEAKADLARRSDA